MRNRTVQTTTETGTIDPNNGGCGDVRGGDGPRRVRSGEIKESWNLRQGDLVSSETMEVDLMENPDGKGQR